MIDFLKSFFVGDYIAGQTPPKKRDMLLLDAYTMGDDEDDQQVMGCGSSCGGCSCH